MTSFKSDIKKLILAAVAILLSNISVYGTIYGCIAAPASAVIISYLTYTCGIGGGVLSGAAAVVFNSVVFAANKAFDPSVLFGCFFAVVPGIVCGICMSKKAKIRSGLIATAFSVIIFPIIYLAYVKYVGKFNVAEFFNNTLIETMNKYFALLKSIYPEAVKGFDGKENEILSLLGIYIPGLLPCFLALFSLIYAAIIYHLGLTASRRSMISNSEFIQGLDCFAMPRYTVIYLLISMIFIFLDTDNITYMMFLNAVVIIFMLYSFEGISFIDYKLKQKNHSFFIRLVLIIGILFALTVISTFMPFLNVVFVLSFIGMTDSAQDLRKCGFNKGEFHEN